MRTEGSTKRPSLPGFHSHPAPGPRETAEGWEGGPSSPRPTSPSTPSLQDAVCSPWIASSLRGPWEWVSGAEVLSKQRKWCSVTERP